MSGRNENYGSCILCGKEVDNDYILCEWGCELAIYNQGDMAETLKYYQKNPHFEMSSPAAFMYRQVMKGDPRIEGSHHNVGSFMEDILTIELMFIMGKRVRWLIPFLVKHRSNGADKYVAALIKKYRPKYMTIPQTFHRSWLAMNTTKEGVAKFSAEDAISVAISLYIDKWVQPEHLSTYTAIVKEFMATF